MEISCVRCPQLYVMYIFTIITRNKYRQTDGLVNAYIAMHLILVACFGIIKKRLNDLKKRNRFQCKIV